MRMFKNMLVLAVLSLLATNVSAQEKSKTSEAPRNGPPVEAKASESSKNLVPLKVTIVFNEYDGERKLSALPYTLSLKAADDQTHYFGSLRMGVRIPISTGGKEAQVRYEDVGSNIDCEARSIGDGRYLLDLRVERSSLFAPKEEHLPGQRTDEQSTGQPLLRAFRASAAVMLRDGQPAQGIVATDPLNGHVLKVDVTLNVLK